MSATPSQVDASLQQINALADDGQTEEAKREVERLRETLEKERNEPREPVQERNTNGPP